MVFSSQYDFVYFKKVSQRSINDSDFSKKLDLCDNLEIPDDIYAILNDSEESYLTELKIHSSGKPFYKLLLVDILKIENIPQLSSLITHISIGLVNRKTIRNNVNIEPYLKLRNKVNSIVDRIIEVGSAQNDLLQILK